MWRSVAQIGGCIGGAAVGAVVAAFPGLLLALVPLCFLGPAALLLVLVAAIGGAIVGGWWGFDAVRMRVAFTMLQCQRCGYALRGCQGDTCPECGRPISAEQKRYRDSPLFGVRAVQRRSADMGTGAR